VEGPIFLCFSVLYAGTYAEGEEDMLSPPKCLEDVQLCLRGVRYQASACIPSQEGTADSTPIGGQKDEDHSEGHLEEQVTPSSSTGKNLNRKGEIQKKTSPFKKGKNPVARVMSSMVDVVISVNSMTSKALNGDFTRESIIEVMTLVKDAGAKESSNEHYIAT
jgi:hypothetical protein